MNQLYFTIIITADPHNLLAVNNIITPKHIIPEWYFLSLYAILKVIPNKNTGFIIIIVFLYKFILIGEFSIMKVNLKLYLNYINIFLIMLFLFVLTLIWIGCELPIDVFIYYGRSGSYLYLLIILLLSCNIIHLFLIYIYRIPVIICIPIIIAMINPIFHK